MKCLQCAQSVPDAARFCPACGAPRGEARAATAPIASERPAARWKVPAIAAGILLGVTGVGAVVYHNGHPVDAPVASQPATPVEEAASVAPPVDARPAVVEGYAWASLSAEELTLARDALDQAIAHEEGRDAQPAATPVSLQNSR